MFNVLLSPFEFPFMVNAFLIASIISVPTALFSCFLILKGWALMGDAISHAVLPGIVLAYIFSVPLIFGALIAGFICAILTEFLAENSRVRKDTVMGIVFSGMFGLGIVIYTKVTVDVHLDHILFGNILGINMKDIVTSFFVALVVLGIIVLKGSDFLLCSFDQNQAHVSGLNITALNYGLLMMLSLTVVSTLSSVGIILSIGLLIAPGAIAFLVTNQFKKMLFVALGTNLFSGLLGVYLSFFIDSAPAPTIILVLSTIFGVVFLFSQIKNHAF